ncbi:MAG: hypothetical protein M3279_00160, partial [Actinomycetota bacterium]|nr:hypothetical protein [Actinomycetota bacterium]
MDHPRGDPYLLTTLPVLKPSLGHEEDAIDSGMTLGTGIAQEYSYLTVGNLAQGAAVLAGHPSRMFPLFDEPSLIHHQDSIRIPQLRHHVPAQVLSHRLMVPGVSLQDSLHPPGMAVARLLGQLPAVLALQVGDEA